MVKTTSSTFELFKVVNFWTMNILLQHDSCPAHYLVVARELTNRWINGRSLGRAGQMN